MAKLPSSGSISLLQVNSQFSTGSLATSRSGVEITPTLGTAGIPSSVPIALQDFYGTTSLKFSSLSFTPDFVDSGRVDSSIPFAFNTTMSKGNDFGQVSYDIKSNSSNGLVGSYQVPFGSSGNSDVFIGATDGGGQSLTDTYKIESAYQPTDPSTMHSNSLTHFPCRYDWNWSGSEPASTPPGAQSNTTWDYHNAPTANPSTPNPPTTSPGPPVTPPGAQVSSPFTIPQPPTPCSNCAPGTAPCSNCAPGTSPCSNCAPGSTPTPATPGAYNPAYAGGACQAGFSVGTCQSYFPTGCGGCSVYNPPSPCSNCAPGTSPCSNCAPGTAPCSNCAPGTTPTPATPIPGGVCYPDISLADCNGAGYPGCQTCTQTPGSPVTTPVAPTPVAPTPGTYAGTVSAGVCYAADSIPNCNSVLDTEVANSFMTSSVRNSISCSNCTSVTPTQSGSESNKTHKEMGDVLNALSNLASSSASTTVDLSPNDSRCPNNYSI